MNNYGKLNICWVCGVKLKKNKNNPFCNIRNHYELFRRRYIGETVKDLLLREPKHKRFI